MRNVLFVFSELSDADIDWLVSAGSRRNVAPGTILVQEGGAIDSIYLLLSGKLEVRKKSMGDVAVSTLNPGEIVGEVSFLDTRPPSATVVAKSACFVHAIARGTMADKLQTDAAFASRFYRALAISLAHRLRSSNARLEAARNGAKSFDDESDELDDHLLDTCTLAGARFDWVLKRFLSA